MTRVLIVDDQAGFRRHLRHLLSYAGLTVVGEAADIPQAEALIADLQPDLAIVDVMLPGVNGLEGTPRLKARSPETRVILVSAHRNQGGEFRAAALAAGAEMFVAKDDLELDLVRTWKRAKRRRKDKTMKVMERRTQTLERDGWEQYAEREKEWIALEKKLGVFPPKRHYRPLAHFSPTVVWERDWESLAAMEAAYEKMAGTPEQKVILDKPSVTLDEHFELYFIPDL